MASASGLPVRPHSVSPKCTSLVVATVASSRPEGRASVRDDGRQVLGGSDALDLERVLGRRFERADPREVLRTGRGHLAPADARRDGDTGIARERDDDLVGPDAHQLRVGRRSHPRRRGSGAVTAPDAARQPPRAALETGPPGAEARPVHPLGEPLETVAGDQPGVRARLDRRDDGRDLLGCRVRRHRPQDGTAHAARGRGCRGVAHRGTFPCLRCGNCSRLVRSMASERTSTRRVSRGSMTSST